MAGAAVFAVFIVWLILALLNDDSTLNAEARYLKETACWTTESNAACVIKGMAKYQKKGRYDDAINVGVAWTQKNPDGPLSAWIYRDLSVLYLKRASQDKANAEAYVKEAILYRDKALPSASDSAYALQPLLVITESAGDLSPSQRCVQYRNSMKVLDRMNVLVNEDKDRLERQFKPDPKERNDLECLSGWMDTSSTRLTTKLSTSGCR
jgi:hypothetical protein